MAAKHWIRLTACIVLLALVFGGLALVQHNGHNRATVLKVVTAVSSAPPHTDHIVVGGRTFRVSEHHVYGHLLQAAVSTDTKGLNNGTGSVTRSRGRLQLNYVYPPESGPYGMRFVDAGGQQVVITGEAGSSPRAMSNLAARLAS